VGHPLTSSAAAWLAGVFDRAAPTYDEVGGGYHEHFGRRLVALADVRAGHAVLDVACGRGAALIPAARAAGRTGRALGGDISPVMVDLARQALRTAGVVGDVAVLDAEHLGVHEGSYDRILCAFGLFFLPRPDVAVAGFRRALRPGGLVAVSTWGDEDERWTWEDDLLAELDVERRAVVRPLDDAESLRELLERAGFVDVSVTAERHDVLLADADEWWAWKWSYSLRGLLEQLPTDRVERLRRDAQPHLDRATTPEGLPITLTALIATGTSPPS
jgi:ubiquinone/menaquinone biosynthesis C-methylase UbiE